MAHKWHVLREILSHCKTFFLRWLFNKLLGVYFSLATTFYKNLEIFSRYFWRRLLLEEPFFFRWVLIKRLGRLSATFYKNLEIFHRDFICGDFFMLKIWLDISSHTIFSKISCFVSAQISKKYNVFIKIANDNGICDGDEAKVVVLTYHAHQQSGTLNKQSFMFQFFRIILFLFF